MKDRMALAMVEAAEADGRLRPGGSVIEYTGGSTGVSLAFVCAAKRIPLQIVTSDAFSKEKRTHMTALGAQLTLVASADGGMTKALTLEMIETAKGLAAAPGSCWMDQLNNADQLSSYDQMGEEIWEQTQGKVGAFVQSVGTAGSLRGITACLRRHDEAVHIAAVEPEESAVLSGGRGRDPRHESNLATYTVCEDDFRGFVAVYTMEADVRTVSALLDRISIDPNVCFGKPCIRGSHRSSTKSIWRPLRE